MLAGAARGQETSPGSRLGERSGAQQTALEGPAVPGQRFGRGSGRGEEGRRGAERAKSSGCVLLGYTGPNPSWIYCGEG